MARSPGGSPAARTLGAELREQRKGQEIPTRAFAELLRVPRTRVSRWESGEALPTPEDVAHYLGALRRIERSEVERLMVLAHEAAESDNWLTAGAYGRGVHQELMTLVEYERTAETITDVAPLLMPGLLQTRAYAEAVLSGLAPDEMDAKLALRLDRRKTLEGKRAPQMEAFIGEPALREPIGGRGVLAEQLDYLLDLSPKRAEVRVIPSGSTNFTPVHNGPFILFTFPNKAAPLVHLESYAAATFLHGAKPVGAYVRAAERVRENAMKPEESRELIVEIRKGME